MPNQIGGRGELPGPIELSARRVHLPAALKEDPKIPVCDRDAGVQADGFTILEGSLIGLARPEQCITEADVSERLAGTDADCIPICVDGLVEEIRLIERDGEIEAGLVEGGLESDGLAELVDGVIEPMLCNEDEGVSLAGLEGVGILINDVGP
jgi:hypothetical protein